MHPNTLTADAIRYTAAELSVYIRGVRGAIQRGKPMTARSHARDYLRLMRDLSELQEAAAADGMTGPLVEPFYPIPFRPQIVGGNHMNAWRPYDA